MQIWFFVSFLVLASYVCSERDAHDGTTLYSSNVSLAESVHSVM